MKLRGFRIELGEIEAALTHAEGVRQAVVLLREDTPGDKRLVAYLVPEVEESFSTTELRRQLQTALPDYMVPSAFVLLSELPLNANGKVNRKALPVPESTGATSGYVAPRTSTEQIVADIWAEVLKVEQVGVEDNFFDLGGHSLLAAQVVSRLRTACKVELKLRALFEAGTVAALAEVIEAETQHDLALLPPLVSVNRAGSLPLSFAQERLWFLDQFEPESALLQHSPRVAYAGPLNVAALESTLNELMPAARSVAHDVQARGREARAGHRRGAAATFAGDGSGRSDSGAAGSGSTKGNQRGCAHALRFRAGAAGAATGAAHR